MTVPPNAQETQVQEASAQQKSQEYNFAQIRKQLEQERAGRLAAEERAAKAEQARLPYKDDEEAPSDEPYVDHRTLKKELKKAIPQIKEEAKNEVRAELRKELDQERKSSYLKQNSDFNDIMKEEHIEKFAQKFPNLAQGILEMPDGFERQKLVYENIKALGIHKKEEAKPTIQDTIEKNRKSPYYSPSGVGTSPYASQGNFSPTGQKDAYNKMQELKNRLRLG